MKCPFLIKRKDVYDDDGKKVDEELELLTCMKNECMVYDSATKLCSLLSSNMKTGVLIDDYKKGAKEIRDEIFQRAEALREGVSGAVDKIQEAVLSRLDVQKKQIEVMILGFDKLIEAFNSKFDEQKGVLQEMSQNITGILLPLGDAIGNQGEGVKSAVQSLQERVSEVNATNMRLSDDLLTGIKSMSERLKDEIVDMKNRNAEVIQGIATRFDDFGKYFSEMSEADGARNQALIEKIGSIDDAMKNVINELRFEASTAADKFSNEMKGHIEGVKNAVVNLKADQILALNNVQGEVGQVRELFVKSSESLEKMVEMVNNLNNNYLESLGKIAGLTEGMRKGVEEIGTSMAKSLNDMTTETKNQLTSVTTQHEKTFSDVVRLTDKFEEVKNRLGDMTEKIAHEFKVSLDRQTELSGNTKDILENMRSFLQKEEQRFEKEQELTRKRTALDHFDRATLYYYRGNYELAASEIDKAIEIDKTAEYLNLKGLILTELGRFEDSKNAYVAALELEPELSELHNNLGLLFLKMKKVDEAVVSFEESVKKNVNNALAYVNLGKALIELERFDDAVSAYNRALEIDPSNQDAREAVQLYKEGKIET